MLEEGNCWYLWVNAIIQTHYRGAGPTVASRFPHAKLVSSTIEDKVIPAFANINDTYGNPDVQLSDNGPPVNSKKISEFEKEGEIQLETIPHHPPSSNPVETFMLTLRKSLKIACRNKKNEFKIL